MIVNGIIWKHSYEILLPVWVRLVLDSSECNGIPIEKERQVLRISEEKCCTETGACIPKNTEAKYIPDIREVLDFGSLHKTRESLRAIRRSASLFVIRLRNFHARSEYNEDGL